MYKENTILLLFFVAYVLSNSTTNYGKFNLILHKFEQCKGPKRKDCCVSTGKILGSATLIYDIIVHEDTTPNKGKIVALSDGKEFLRMQMKRPCDHLFLGPLLQRMVNITKNCFVKKGYYNFKVDLQEVAQKYYGGTFLFGNWTFKSVFYSDVCNFSCSIVNVELSPKNKTL